MTNDRELLELAAKAAGYHFHGHRVGLDYANCYVSTTGNSDDWFVWSPLTDDGDALRLAVRVNLEMCIAAPITYARMAMQEGISAPISEFHAADAMAATRRAIVRAAANATEGTEA